MLEKNRKQNKIRGKGARGEKAGKPLKLKEKKEKRCGEYSRDEGSNASRRNGRKGCVKHVGIDGS